MSTQTDTKFTPGPWTPETVKTIFGICHRIGYAYIDVDYPNNGLAERKESK